MGMKVASGSSLKGFIPFTNHPLSFLFPMIRVVDKYPEGKVEG